MEVKINVEKKHLVGFLVVFGIIAGLGVAFAGDFVGSTGVGHDIGEIDWASLGSCDAGSSISQINVDGTVVCEVDDGLAGVTAGEGLSGSEAAGVVTLSANFGVTQRRVFEECPLGQSIRVIGGAGGVTCIAVGGGGTANTDYCPEGNCPSPLSITGGTDQLEIGNFLVSDVERRTSLLNTELEQYRIHGFRFGTGDGDWWLWGVDDSGNTNSFYIIHKIDGARARVFMRIFPDTGAMRTWENP